MSDVRNREAASEALLELWFSERAAKLWFRSTPAFDRELRERFEGVVRAALRGELDDWADSPRGALALVIVLDQLPLNIYRGTPESFAGEQKARTIAAAAIARGWDQGLSDKQKAFLYLPFMHSENLADQERSVALYEAAGLSDNLRFARHHRSIIERFGRFPHRNAILDRESTSQERAWLNSKEAFHG